MIGSRSSSSRPPPLPTLVCRRIWPVRRPSFGFPNLVIAHVATASSMDVHVRRPIQEGARPAAIVPPLLALLPRSHPHQPHQRRVLSPCQKRRTRQRVLPTPGVRRLPDGVVLVVAGEEEGVVVGRECASFSSLPEAAEMEPVVRFCIQIKGRQIKPSIQREIKIMVKVLVFFVFAVLLTIQPSHAFFVEMWSRKSTIIFCKEYLF